MIGWCLKLPIFSNWNIVRWISYIIYIQPERWLRIRKLEAQGPSNSYFFNAGKFTPQQAEGPSNSLGILSYVLHCICTIWSELKRGNEVELADLTRGMRKKWFFRAWKIVFCKAGLVWVSWEQCGFFFWAWFFFAKPGFSEFHKSSVETMFQVPTSIHISILLGLEAVQACAKKTIFRNLKNCFSAKPGFIP